MKKLLALALLVAALVVSGCGGSESAKKDPAPAKTFTKAEKQEAFERYFTLLYASTNSSDAQVDLLKAALNLYDVGGGTSQPAKSIAKVQISMVDLIEEGDFDEKSIPDEIVEYKYEFRPRLASIRGVLTTRTEAAIAAEEYLDSGKPSDLIDVEVLLNGNQEEMTTSLAYIAAVGRDQLDMDMDALLKRVERETA